MSQGVRTDLDSPMPGIQALLEVLPDLIALAAEDGRPIVVPDPGTDHGRALLATLGVQITPASEERGD